MTPKPKDWLNDKIINHETGQPEDYVDYLLEQEYNKYPSSLIDIPETEKQAGDRAFYDELGKSLARNIDPNKPIGKQVI